MLKKIWSKITKTLQFQFKSKISPNKTCTKQNMKKQFFTEGVTYMIISTICFTAMQGLIKYLPQDRIPTIEQTFFRSFITAIFCLVFMLKNHITFDIKNVKLIWIRSIVGSISMFSFFYILPRMPLGTSVTIKYLYLPALK